MQESPARAPLTVCRGVTLISLRVAWALLALAALIPAVGSFIELGRLKSLNLLLRVGIYAISPDIERGFQELGLNRETLLGADLVFRLVGLTVFTVTALVIFARKSNDWMTGLVSATLLTAGTSWFAPLGALPEGSLLDSVAGILGDDLPFGAGLGASLAGVLLILFMYLFPDGRFVPAWTRYAAVALAVHFVAWVAFPASIVDPATWLVGAQILFIIVVAGSGLGAQVYRLLFISGPVHRQQTKLVVAALVVIAGVMALLFALNPGLGAGFEELVLVTPRVQAVYDLVLLMVLGLVLLEFPLSIGISVLRYRLWDIDVFINRTLVYGALTAILGLAYFAIVAAVGAVASQSFVTAAAATLSVAVAFQPLRRRLQDLIDRQFYRRRYDAAKSLDAFTIRLREQIDLKTLSRELLRVVEQTMRPRGISLWIPKSLAAPLGSGAGTMQRIGFWVDPNVDQLKGTDFDELSIESETVDLLRSTHAPIELGVDGLPPALRSLEEVGVSLTVPLVSQGELVGVLNLGPRLSGAGFSSDDRSLLERLSDHAASAVRVALLVREHESDLRARERIDNEMRVAQLIQRQFLPKELPQVEGWQVHAYYRAAREVGGDFYDFIALPDGRLAIVAGDVTGKGVPAALVMATTRSILRGEAPRLPRPGLILRQANEQLVADIPTNMFVTCLCAVVDTRSGRVSIANAGHNLPVVRTDTGVTEARARGMPLGLMSEAIYEECEIELEPGHCFFLYSDGVSEAHNPGREMFGLERMRTLLIGCGESEAMIEHVLDALHDFTGPDWEQEDDISLVVLHRKLTEAAQMGAVTAGSGHEPVASARRR